MAMFDNRQFLINHIRNSFITSDETGMCELILECNVLSSQTQPQPVAAAAAANHWSVGSEMPLFVLYFRLVGGLTVHIEMFKVKGINQSFS